MCCFLSARCHDSDAFRLISVILMDDIPSKQLTEDASKPFVRICNILARHHWQQKARADKNTDGVSMGLHLKAAH